MAYDQSLTTFVRSTGRHDARGSLRALDDCEREIVAAIFCVARASKIADASIPGGIELPLSAKDLYLYPFAELEQRQIGCRTGWLGVPDTRKSRQLNDAGNRLRKLADSTRPLSPLGLKS